MNDVVRLPRSYSHQARRNRPILKQKSSRRFGRCFAGSRRTRTEMVCVKRPLGWCAPIKSTFQAIGKIRSRTFARLLRRDGYDEMVVLRGIPFESHCEHHVAPIIGRAWVAYVPDRASWASPSLARMVEAYARRLQITGTPDGTDCQQHRPGTEATRRGRGDQSAHHCMSSRGVHMHGTDMVTSRMLGCFRDNPMTRQEFASMVD
jgi:GTP cyclohydrolase I